jgi:hypothetical protein
MTQKYLVFGLALILAYLTWVWGGLRLAWLPPAVWASWVLLGFLLATSWVPSRVDVSRSLPWWRDPFFYIGLLFLGYLALQWWNADRVLFFDVGFNEWRYSPPLHPDWPSAFSRPEAAQMLSWFFPAWVLGLTVRSPAVSKAALMGLLRGLVYSAGLLATFGVVQFLTRTRLQYWVASTGDGFFASFGYTNHAAAYFVLMGALAAGLLFREIFRSDVLNRGGKRPLEMTALAVSLLLCLIGANLSLSRAGVILAWALAGFVAAYGLIHGWGKLKGAGRVNLAVVTVAVLFVFYFAVAGFGSKDISREFAVKKPIHHLLFPVLDNVDLALGGRVELDEAAWRMWQDHKLLGIGGWGYRYLLAFYMPKSEWKGFVQRLGSANVHCDPLQFLTEFGIVGFGLMLATLAVLILSLLPKGERARVRVSVTRQDPLRVMGVIGLSLVVIFSLIDLPFRCPAILCTWIVILAALPIVTEVRIHNNP